MPPQTSRTYAQIIREDVFTLMNNILFVLCLALLFFGQVSEAIVSAGVVLFNVVISVIQEIRSKHALDRIALLTRPKATVIRDGHEQFIDPGAIVQGDLLAISVGDQIVVDGPLVGEGQIEVDESLLTGESNPVTKQNGDLLYSGSFCIAGTAYYHAAHVGIESVAGQITAKARAFRRILTPLQRQINSIIQALLLVALYIEIILILVAVANQTPVVETVRMSVIVVSIVPIGLFLATSVSYAMGALRIAGKNALVQRLSAIESLSNVDALCLDKTGTLTTNTLVLEKILPLGITEIELRQLLALYVAHTSSQNATSAAIGIACGTQDNVHFLHIRDEILFSSARKWSALSITDTELRGIYVLGAPEVLLPFLQAGAELGPFIEEETMRGMRVLLFAYSSHAAPLHTIDARPALPTNLRPLGMVSLRDELRHAVQETLIGFSEVGIKIKVISGDHPHTVAALAQQVGIANTHHVVTGGELDQLDEEQLAQLAEETTIFGRITPQQKERLVRALRMRNHYVAMIGDGVNDILSLKQANLGIAMESGSQATRGIADIVLLHDSFAALPSIFAEGQRIRNGMESAMKLFLTRVMYLTFLLFTIPALGGFPFAPKQKALVTFETVGVIAVALTAWAHPGPPTRHGLMRVLLRFSLPAAVTLSLVAFGVYLVAFLQAQEDASNSIATAQLIAQSALTTFAVCSGLLLVPFVVPPTRFWSGGSQLSGDWRPTLLAVGLMITYLIVITIAPLRAFFSLAALGMNGYLLIGTASLLWSIIQRWIWRAHLFERFLKLDYKE
ncbi:cation transporter E1-E2 family ATPase [Dictyobacter arantiisoli]|uniref:Cation transporter E1-E2 family ATPase n=2 Tax=Dictyobacter arantiisoli TaxID=2014874 RepID=A0A5A5TCK6_9CHLR|nr:cation transporter E1-E2 family ATPase [Dictyobacter arantiisoli]